MAGRSLGGTGSALQTPRGTSTPNSARRRRPVVAEEDEEDMIRSLQIKNDDRYIAMHHYKEQSKNQSSDGHFARMLRASCVRAPGQAPGERIQQPAVGNIDNRIDWQQSFDHNVRRLLVDFQLSDVPSCRLQHLERMHSWFQEHGAKQTRKTQEGPCYLTADRSGSMPAGSTKDLPHNTSAATQLLSKTFRKS